MKEALSEITVEKDLAKVKKEIDVLVKKRKSLIDMRLDEDIDKESYDFKYSELSDKLNSLNQESQILEKSFKSEGNIKKRLMEFSNLLLKNQVVEEFERGVFESIVEEVIVGGIDEDGIIDPYKIVFINKTRLVSNHDVNKFKPKRKNTKKNENDDFGESSLDLCSQASNEDINTCSHTFDHTCGDHSIIRKI